MYNWKVLSQDVYNTFADRKDRLYIVADIFDLATIFTDTRISEKTDGILLVLERDSGHIETYLRGNTKRVRLVWRTYFQDLQPYQLGRGFRILAYPSGKYIMTFIYHARILYLRRNSKRVRHVWLIYFQDLQPNQSGRGFRILAYPSGKYNMPNVNNGYRNIYL